MPTRLECDMTATATSADTNCHPPSAIAALQHPPPPPPNFGVTHTTNTRPGHEDQGPPQGGANRMSTNTIDPLVIVRLNEQTDVRGIPLGMVRGYEPGDALVPAVLFRHPVEKSEAGIAAALEQVWELLNVGDDPAFINPPSPVALRYRARGCRSLSVGDVVEVFDARYAVARFGFQRLVQRTA